MKETGFEVLPLHEVVDITPIPPETKVVPPSGGLSTETSTVLDCAMSVAEMVATSSWLLTNVVTRNEPFQLTKESWWKSLPLTVNRNWLPPAVALLGEIEVMDGAGAQVPQERAVASVIANAANMCDLATVAIGLHLGKLADAKRGAGRQFEKIGGTSGASQLVRQIPQLYP